MHAYLSRAFQWYQKRDKSHHGLEDDTQNKINNFTS
jgi:hypothetical protein